MDARLFATTNDILQCLSFVQSLLQGRNAPIWRNGRRQVKQCVSRTGFLNPRDISNTGLAPTTVLENVAFGKTGIFMGHDAAVNEVEIQLLLHRIRKSPEIKLVKYILKRAGREIFYPVPPIYIMSHD